MFNALPKILWLLALLSCTTVHAANTEQRQQLTADCTATHANSLICQLLPYAEPETPTTLCAFLQRINSLDYATRENYLNARLIGSRTLEQLTLPETKINCTDKLAIVVKMDFAASHKEKITVLLNKQQQLQQLHAQALAINGMDIDSMIKQIDTVERTQGGVLLDTTYTLNLSEAVPKTVEFSEMPVKYTVDESIAYVESYLKRAKNEIMQSGLNIPQPITHYDFKQATDKYIQAEKEKSDKEILKLEQWRRKLKGNYYENN